MVDLTWTKDSYDVLEEKKNGKGKDGNFASIKAEKGNKHLRLVL